MSIIRKAVRFSPRVGIDGRDMAAFNDPIVRRQFFRTISDRIANIYSSINALSRKGPQAPGPYLAMHREISQHLDTLRGIRSRRLAVPNELLQDVINVKLKLKDILKSLEVSCSDQ
ncbi:hypothetical protein HZC35_01305 [Candidatus Saganbacteria bacterium]|nr:hypothetical protein [Candidatus Saganbacteria bacterium]